MLYQRWVNSRNVCYQVELIQLSSPNSHLRTPTKLPFPNMVSPADRRTTKSSIFFSHPKCSPSKQASLACRSYQLTATLPDRFRCSGKSPCSGLLKCSQPSFLSGFCTTPQEAMLNESDNQSFRKVSTKGEETLGLFQHEETKPEKKKRNKTPPTPRSPSHKKTPHIYAQPPLCHIENKGNKAPDSIPAKQVIPLFSLCVPFHGEIFHFP